MISRVHEFLQDVTLNYRMKSIAFAVYNKHFCDNKHLTGLYTVARGNEYHAVPVNPYIASNSLRVYTFETKASITQYTYHNN